ncbi:DHA1 family arabinose polymer transporter-like MFS transporter [Dyadobacter jejuensis]|uniref:DHA1 family arabinose polymer transporter-like MFS transporter n=1 Tax=Dyadobacter jejuensis TaxID=1082580 RepID=A0A316AMQ8_9BACT|nr:MFS transporter [Dyadobacter jejuensis]PWJ58738.1 DHA1 family arabinose polymer transporter-like MFS transporter [Dyadobacter jejuensis]
MKKGLIALAIGAFALGMTEFVMMGILPDMAKALHISIPEAGHLISAYAIGVVIGAPVLTIFLQNKPPKTSLLLLAAWIMLSNSLAAFAIGYKSMLLLRFIAGIPHGAYFGIGAVVAGRMAEKGKTAQAVAFMFTGLTVANIVGVPAGTFIGHEFDWRITFGIVGLIGIITLLGIRFWLPTFQAKKSGNIRNDFAIFRQKDMQLILLITIIGTGGFFAWYSYIAPLFTEVSGFDAASVTYLMVVAGIGMTAGNVLGGKLSDRFTPLWATIMLLAAMAVVLVLLVVVAESKALVILITFIIGAVAFAVVAPVQILIMEASQKAEMLGSSIGPAAMNVGNALGAFLAGLPIAWGYGFTAPEWVGAGLALLGLLLSLILYRYKSTQRVEPTAKEDPVLV